MGNLNFQDDPNQKPPQKQPDPVPHHLEDSQVDDIFVDGQGAGSKILLIAVAVIVIAGIGGGLYLLNKKGYLKFGHKAPVVAVQPAAAPPAAPVNRQPVANAQPAREPGKFSVQVSAFKTESQANRAVQNLKQKGLDAYMFASDVPNEGKWFKVCVGTYDTKLKALAETARMKEKVGTDVWVVAVQ